MNYTFQPNDWRTRVGIFVNAEFDDTTFQVSSCALRISSFEDRDLGCNYIVESYSRKDDFPNIIDAHYFSIDRINEFLDQLSLISYFPCTITHVFSTTVFSAVVGEKFDMIIPNDYHQEKNSVKISSSDLKLKEEELSRKEYAEALRQTREGLTTDIPESKFLHFYAALERIAEAHTQERIISKCPQCGFEHDKGPATSNYLRELFKEKGLSSKKYNRLRGVRGKVAHGAGNRDIKFLEEIRELTPLLESTALETVSLHTGIKIKSNFNAHTSQQFWELIGVKIQERSATSLPIFNVLGRNYSFTAMFTAADVTPESEITSEQGGFLTPEIVLDEHLNIHPESWPY
jgi:hypothetical protein